MISERIQYMRSKRGLTQDEVASRIGVSRPTYTNYENGKREPDLNTVKKLADVFNTSVDYLIGNTNDSSPIDSPSNMPADWILLYEQIRELGLELEAKTILRTASGMSKETLEDVLKMLQHVKSRKDNS